MDGMVNGFSKTYVLSTGNILNVADLRKKAGQKPTEELLDSLIVTVRDSEKRSLDCGATEIRLKDNDLLSKIKELPRDDLKIGVKVFMNCYSKEYLHAAIDLALETLDVCFLDSLVLAFHPKCRNSSGDVTTPEHEVKEGVIQWGDGTRKCFDKLLELWAILEEYVEQKKICLLGVSDISYELLKELFETSKVQPAITQINLSACCVVPPDIKNFCNEKEIQLLTHSDPQEIISKSDLKQLDLGDIIPLWALRYQVHVKCRGVLQSKGFIVAASSH